MPALSLVAAFCSGPGYARAQSCPVIDGGSEALEARSVDERMDFLLERARSGEEAARTWTTIYGLAYMGIAVSQLGVLSLSSDRDTRTGARVGAISSLIGVASLFVLPLAILDDRDEIDALAAEPADCERLARIEALVLEGAESEAFGTSWLVHLGSILFNVAIGLVLGVGEGLWVNGAISAGVGIAIGELQILTQPTELVGALERYRRGAF